MTATPRVLVVVISTDDGHWLGPCLKSLANAGGGSYEIVVLANACTDDTENVCRSAGVRVLRVEDRLGFAAANNHALYPALARGFDYAYLLNPDTRVAPDAIARLVDFLDRRPEYGILGSLQFEYGNDAWEEWNAWSRDTVAHARELGGVPETTAAGTCLDHYYVQGAAMMFRLSLVPSVGLLDPLYETFYEETDLCRRCLLTGRKVGILFDSRVQHAGGGHWRGSAAAKQRRDRLFLRNQFFYYLSGAESPRATVATAARLLVRQLRAVAFRREDVTLEWWRYPAVLASVFARARFIPRLSARNQLIRGRRPLPRLLWSIGPPVGGVRS